MYTYFLPKQNEHLLSIFCHTVFTIALERLRVGIRCSGCIPKREISDTIQSPMRSVQVTKTLTFKQHKVLEEHKYNYKTKDNYSGNNKLKLVPTSQPNSVKERCKITQLTVEIVTLGDRI